MHEYIGVAHIHSRYSDGTGEIPDIVRAAAELRLDFMLMTDHNSLRPKKDGWEGWRDGVAVIIGYEINDRRDRNHYLAFGLDETVGVRIPAREYVRRVRAAGGIGFIAHPDEKRDRLPEHPSYPWDAWDAEDFDGIEIWNHMSEWTEGLTEENKYQRFIHPLKSIIAPPAETLRRWDALNRIRRVTALGGTDAHAHKADVMGFFNVEVFPYKVMFRSIHTHVLLDEPLHCGSAEHFAADSRRILEALRAGHAFVANSYHGDARGFEFHATQNRVRHPQGSELAWDPGHVTRLTVRAPQRCDLRLLRNGDIVAREDGTDLSHKVSEPGAYRVEAWLRGKGWIFSNHIRIRTTDGRC
jgi:hypothetical protein